MKYFSLCFLCLLIAMACSKDDTNLPADQEPQPLPADNQARLTAQKLYEDYYLASVSTSADIAWNGDEPNCLAGEVPEGTKDKILLRISYYRKAAGLHNSLAENTTKSLKAQQAALMMHANGQLEHFPPDSWKCYSSDGNEGAGNSLLTMTRNAEAITSYLRDQGANNGPVGHRRWLLWPRLSEIGIGNTDQANAIWVIGNPGTPPADAPEFIAWPPAGYIPATVVYPRWSFSVAGADFNSASVRMLDSNGNSISLQTEALSNAYGDPTIVWVPQGVSTNGNADTVYFVQIENVSIDGELQDFEYQVTLFDPAQ